MPGLWNFIKARQLESTLYAPVDLFTRRLSPSITSAFHFSDLQTQLKKRFHWGRVAYIVLPCLWFLFLKPVPAARSRGG